MRAGPGAPTHVYRCLVGLVPREVHQTYHWLSLWGCFTTAIFLQRRVAHRILLPFGVGCLFCGFCMSGDDSRLRDGDELPRRERVPPPVSTNTMHL